MSVHPRPQSHVPEPEGDGREPAPDERLVPRPRTRTMLVIGIGILGLFLILLAVGVVPRVHTHPELVVAAQKAQNTPPEVYVIRPEPASEADLSLSATTQAPPNAIIYAPTHGDPRKPDGDN